MSENSEQKSNKKTQKLHQEIQNEINSLKHDIKEGVINKDHFERFYKLCDKLSYSINLLTIKQKKDYYSEIVKIRRSFFYSRSSVLRQSFPVISRLSSDKTLFIGRVLGLIGNKHKINKSFDFLNEYILASKADCQTTETYRNCIQRLAQEYDLSKITVSTNNDVTNGKNITQLYDDAYIFKKRGKKEEANACLKQIRKFLDKQAFKHYATLSHIYHNFISYYRNYLGINKFKTIEKKYANITKKLSDEFALSRPSEGNFMMEYNKYFRNLILLNYTDEFIESYNIVRYNPFNVITNHCLIVISGLPRESIANYIFSDIDLKNFLSFLSDNNLPPLRSLTNRDIPSFDEKKIRENFHNPDTILHPDFNIDIVNFTLKDTSFFERSSLEQEKPVIVAHPDHPEKGKPVIAAHPGHPEKSKPKIVDHGEMPETSLKDQAADRSQEQEDIKDMFVLPPSEALDDKTLSETLLAYGFIKAIPVLKKSTVYLLSRSFTSLERFLGSYLPKLSFSTVAPLKRTKSSSYFKEAPLNRSNIASVSDSKKLKSRTRTIVNKKTVSVTKKAFTAKGGFILTGVTVGLETLHARLKNAGYKRTAFFIPVASNFRPWGEAYFSTADNNLGIDPSAGYSTTRLFTHIADGTAYVFEGFSNIVYTAGEVEKFVYRLILSEKATGFDTGHLGVVNGLSEAVGSFVDSMGGSLEIRRAKALAEFRSNISSYETPLGKKMRVSKLCIDRGLSHLPKEKTHMNRIKKISGTYSQTKKQMKHSLLHDYMPTEIGNSILNIKIGHLNKDPFKVIKILKPNNCLKRYVKKPVLGTTSIPKKNVPKFNTSVVNTDIMIIQR